MISGEVGLHKPQPEIFELGAERVGLEPSDCVFVDDLRENCAGAEAVGMTAVLHRDTRRDARPARSSCSACRCASASRFSRLERRSISADSASASARVSRPGSPSPT